MKKFLLPWMVAVILCYSNLIFSATIKTIHQESNWGGFYIGANAGYWKTPTNKITATGSTNFINQTFELGASNIANALAQMATNSFSLHPNGFFGGGQVGYNFQFNKRILLGLQMDLDGLTNSNNTHTLQKTVELVDFSENYVGSLSVKQKMNYLGTLRARLGYLFCPDFLVYGSGGFGYGNVTLDADWTAQESLGPTVFPGIDTQSHLSKTLTGWTAGVGVEWLFKPNWSTSLEYTYYNLNGLNVSTDLVQINESISPPALWGSAAAKTALSLSVGTIRLGVNFHFS